MIRVMNQTTPHKTTTWNFRSLRYALAGILIGLGAASLTNCATTAGLGQDVQTAGEELEEAAY